MNTASPFQAIFLTLSLLYFSPPFQAEAQEVNSDCIDPTLLQLPFERTESKEERVQQVEYEEADRFTFWYRLEVEKEDSLDILITSTDPQDIYDASLYRYDGKRICKKVVHGDLDPIGIASLQSSPPEERVQGFHPVHFQDLQLEAGGRYFLSVSRVGGKGCGHLARFRTGEQSVEVRAKARDCFRIPDEPEPKKPDPIDLKIALTDSADGALIPGEIMVMDRKTGKKDFLELKGDSPEKLKVELDRKYRFKGKAVGYKDSSIEGSFRSDTSIQLDMARMEKGERMILRRIYFHPNTYAFRKESWTALEALYSFLEKHPKARIEIQGHTASDRTIEESNPLYKDKGKEWNFTGDAGELSLLRAKAVKKELVEKGVDEERLRTKGFGADRKLIEDPETRREEQKNMRVEVVILE